MYIILLQKVQWLWLLKEFKTEYNLPSKIRSIHSNRLVQSTQNCSSTALPLHPIEANEGKKSWILHENENLEKRERGVDAGSENEAVGLDEALFDERDTCWHFLICKRNT